MMYEYPASLRSKLNRIRHYHAAIVILAGFAVAVSVLLALMMLVMLIDWWFVIFDNELRAWLSLGTILIASVVSIRVAWRPLCQSLRWTHAARMADEAVPTLQQRWATVIQSSQAPLPQSPTYRAMLGQVTSEAVALSPLVRPSDVVSPAPLQRAGLWMSGCVLALALLLLADWPRTKVLLQRFWSFGSEVSATQVECLSGDLVVPRGEAVQIEFSTSGLMPDEAQLCVAGSDTPITIALAPQQTSGSVSFTLAAVEQEFSYRIRCGDGQTSWHHVTVLERPEIQSLHVAIDAPAYVQRPRYEKDYLPARVKAVQGSRFAFELVPKSPIERVEVAIEYGPESAEGERTTRATVAMSDDGVYRFETQLLENVVIRPSLVSRDGLNARDEPLCRVQVIQDKAPVARVITPNVDTEVDPDSPLEIKFEAHDDYGIAKVELVVYEESANADEAPRILSVQEVPLGDERMSKHLVASTTLDLNQFDWKEHPHLSYAIRVTDNRGIDPPMEQTQPPGMGPHPAATAARDNAPKESGDVQPNEATSGGAAPDKAKLAMALDRAKDGRAGEASADEASAGEASADEASADEGRLSQGRGDESDGDMGGADMNRADALSETVPQAEPSPQELESQPAIAASDSSQPRSNNQPTPDENGLLAADLPLSPIDTLSPEQKSGMLRRSLDASSGQGFTSVRMQLKIAERVALADQTFEPQKAQLAIKDTLLQIDTGLEAAQTLLTAVSESAGSDDESPTRREEQLVAADEQLVLVSQRITETNAETEDTPYAFVGLQLVNLGRVHVTPARDRILWIRRDPAGESIRVKSNAIQAVSHVTRAREFIASVREKIQSNQQDEKLADGLDELAKIYEIYIENTQRLLRQASVDRNPLQRKMGIVELDETYLARRTEVEEMRREMMAEFARLLADDPRLLRRYLDTVRRRQSTVRDRFSEASERQLEIAEEVAAWIKVDETQRSTLWRILIEMRLQQAQSLATLGSEIADRVEAQMPLDLNTGEGTAADVLKRAGELAVAAEEVSLVAKKQAELTTESDLDQALGDSANRLCMSLEKLTSTLQQLTFESAENEDHQSFLTERIAEVADYAHRADQWRQIAAGMLTGQYFRIAASDQQYLSLTTQALSLELNELETTLAGIFATEETEMPEAIREMARSLKLLLEDLGMNQTATVYCLANDSLAQASVQLEMAVERFQRAEELFDDIRRSTVEILDEQEMRNPNIADLRDPTLDAFLTQLEREPRLAQQLELGSRNTNLRVMSDWMLWQARNGEQQSMRMQQMAQAARRRQTNQIDVSDPQPNLQNSPTRAEQTQPLEDMLTQSIERLEQRARDEQTTPEQAAKLRQQAAKLRDKAEQMKQWMDDQNTETSLKWNALVQSDRAQAILTALARGDELPDDQWNTLFSSLEQGLWQVRGRTPPEAYRRAIQQYQETIRQATSP